MDKKSIILVVIIILVVALAALGIYITSNGSGNEVLNLNTSDLLGNSDDNDTAVNETVIDVDNDTVVGDDSPRENATDNNTNSTYKVYNPQSDSYVPVIGEKYDEEVNRWYTYDTDGVRYYNTRINQN